MQHAVCTFNIDESSFLGPPRDIDVMSLTVGSNVDLGIGLLEWKDVWLFHKIEQ